MDRVTFFEAAAEAPFLGGLTVSERRRLADLARPLAVEPGTVLLREGSETTELGIVRTGRVALRLTVPMRGIHTILTVEPGDVFGWSALVPPFRSTSTAVATEPTTGVVFPARALREALDRDEELAAALYPRILRTVARRLEATRLQLLDLFAQDAGTPW
ncbi:MAG TPA: cyclic nucleotide-binding domain-containing protein [Candidatus Limnocylindrales bacterium]|nr:cyclic nucleotide-binding domain-containing protein [Candidatus Limnocylindrales bacterium]